MKRKSKIHTKIQEILSLTYKHKKNLLFIAYFKFLYYFVICLMFVIININWYYYYYYYYKIW